MKLICATAALAALVVSPVYAACVEPTGPTDIPDGNTAQLQDMLKTQKAIAAYNAATNSYIVCLQQEHDTAVKALAKKKLPKDKLTVAVQQIDKDQADKQNHAVDALNAVAGQFNQQVQIFKAKLSGKSG